MAEPTKPTTPKDDDVIEIIEFVRELPTMYLVGAVVVGVVIGVVVLLLIDDAAHKRAEGNE